MALPDHFEGEDVIITFEKEWISTDSGWTAATAIQNVEGKILSWNIGGGAQSVEDIYAFGNKTFSFSKPREKFTATFDVVVNSGDFALVNFGGQTSAKIGSMPGKIVKSADTPRRWRVIMWFQNSAYHVRNTARTILVPSKTQSCYRMIFVDCKAVSFDREFSADEYLKGTLTLEFSATDSKGYSNWIEEEGLFTGTTATALKSMTSSAGTGIMAEARGYLTYSATTTPSWTAGTTATKYRIA
jgi:hypothetical protein